MSTGMLADTHTYTHTERERDFDLESVEWDRHPNRFFFVESLSGPRSKNEMGWVERVEARGTGRGRRVTNPSFTGQPDSINSFDPRKNGTKEIDAGNEENE